MARIEFVDTEMFTKWIKANCKPANYEAYLVRAPIEMLVVTPTKSTKNLKTAYIELIYDHEGVVINYLKSANINTYSVERYVWDTERAQ